MDEDIGTGAAIDGASSKIAGLDPGGTVRPLWVRQPVPIQGKHLMTCQSEALNKLSSDEAGCARYQHFVVGHAFYLFPNARISEQFRDVAESPSKKLQ
jgi:hypothetical protein